ncbi:MAG: mechanosensitive ion channel [Anaerolinea sp.]|nr:mechanosensitive ion channel [Anaerolinea sp.]
MPTETVPVLNPTEQIIAFIPQILLAIVIVLIFWIVSFLFRGLIKRFGHRTRLDEAVLDLLTQVFGLGIIIVGLLTALGTIGVDVSALVAGLGITTFAVAFALQDIISNLLSGILILMYRPFRRGNWIRVGGHEGVVTDIDLRYTTLQTETQRILVPNSTLFKESIIVTTSGAPTLPQAAPPRPMQPPR